MLVTYKLIVIVRSKWINCLTQIICPLKFKNERLYFFSVRKYFGHSPIRDLRFVVSEIDFESIQYPAEIC